MRAIFELDPRFWASPPADVAALRAAEALLARASPTDLAWLDPRYRTIARRDRHPESLLALDSFHPDGRIRERAVVLYSEIRDGSELPYLVIRANDGVEKIRYLAARSLLERIDACSALGALPCARRADGRRVAPGAGPLCRRRPHAPARSRQSRGADGGARERRAARTPRCAPPRAGIAGRGAGSARAPCVERSGPPRRRAGRRGAARGARRAARAPAREGPSSRARGRAAGGRCVAPGLAAARGVRRGAPQSARSPATSSRSARRIRRISRRYAKLRLGRAAVRALRRRALPSGPAANASQARR